MPETYVTPVIPFADFADYNPGHGTETVRDTVLGLRDAYAASKIKKIVGPTGIQFAVTGACVDLARLAALYGQQISGRPLARPTDEHRAHMRTVDTWQLGAWLADGMYTPGSPLHAAALDELHARADDEVTDRRWGDHVAPVAHLCDETGCTPESCYQRYRSEGGPALRYDEWVEQASDYEHSC
jgi:hypothetical protein